MTQPARFEHSVEDAEALYRGFVVWYWLLFAVFLVSSIWARQMLLVAVLFGAVLLLWQRQIAKVPKLPWVLTIDRERITVDRAGDLDFVHRGSAESVLFVRRRVRGAAYWELLVLGPRKKRLFREGVRDDHKAGMEQALEDFGWPR